MPQQELAKPVSHFEIVNDKNDELINFLLVLRDHEDELYRRCEGLPYSESLFVKYKTEPVHQDPIERAVRFSYIVRAGFSGGGHKYKTGFSVSIRKAEAKPGLTEIPLSSCTTWQTGLKTGTY